MTPDEIYAMCRTDEGRDEYCRQFATTKWLVKKSPSTYIVLSVLDPHARLVTPAAGSRFRMVTGLEHGGNFDLVHVAESTAEWMVETTPEDWFIVDDRDVAELVRMHKMDSGDEPTKPFGVTITFGKHENQ